MEILGIVIIGVAVLVSILAFARRNDHRELDALSTLRDMVDKRQERQKDE